MGKSNQWVMGSDGSDEHAWIEDANGEGIVRLERVNYGLISSPGQASATDAQWQTIIDQIAVAPEMLAMLKDIRERCDNANVTMGTHTLETFLRHTRNAIDDVLKKAEPPRVVTKTANVVMQVDVEAFSDAPDDVVRAMAIAQVRKGEGFVTGGQVIR